MADNAIYALGIADKYLGNTTLIRSALPLGSCKTSLDTSPPKILSLRCKKISKTKNELDGQSSRLLVSTHVLNYAASFPPGSFSLFRIRRR